MRSFFVYPNCEEPKSINPSFNGKANPFIREIVSKKGIRAADVFPLNGTAKNRRFKITDFVKPSHREEMRQHFNLLNRFEAVIKEVRCVVIDFKDTEGRYERRDEIAAAEKAFSSFFQEDGPKKAGVLS